MKTCSGWAAGKRGVLLVLTAALHVSVFGGVGEPFPIAGQSQLEGGGACPAFDGTNVLIGIESGETNKIVLQFIHPENGLVGSRIDLGIYGNSPQIGYGAGNYLLTWNTAVSTNVQLFGQRLSPQGSALGTPFQISFSPGNAFPNDLARLPFGAGKFLAVWADDRNTVFDPQYPDETDTDLYARFVNPDGTLGPQEITVAQYDGEDDNYAVACNGTNFLVVFSAERRAGFYDGEDVYGQFVAPGVGRVGNNFVIDQNDLPSSNPTAVCWDGEKYTVLFPDAHSVGPEDEQWDILARFVSPSGIVSTNRIAIADNPFESEMFPTIAFSDGRYLITLTSFTTPSNSMSKARFYDSQLTPQTPWFLLAPPTEGSAAISSAIAADSGKFVAGTSYIVWIPSEHGDGDDAMFVRTDGMRITPDAPQCIDGSLSAANYTLIYSNLFPGTSNTLERIGSLTSTNGWTAETAFFCTSASTNLSGTLNPSWNQQFFRLKTY